MLFDREGLNLQSSIKTSKNCSLDNPDCVIATRCREKRSNSTEYRSDNSQNTIILGLNEFKPGNKQTCFEMNDVFSLDLGKLVGQEEASLLLMYKIYKIKLSAHEKRLEQQGDNSSSLNKPFSPMMNKIIIKISNPNNQETDYTEYTQDKPSESDQLNLTLIDESHTNPTTLISESISLDQPCTVNTLRGIDLSISDRLLTLKINENCNQVRRFYVYLVEKPENVSELAKKLRASIFAALSFVCNSLKNENR